MGTIHGMKRVRWLLGGLFVLAAAACGDGPIETAEDCEAAGHTVRPAPGPRAQCLEGETEVASVPFGVAGAACCRED